MLEMLLSSAFGAAVQTFLTKGLEGAAAGRARRAAALPFAEAEDAVRRAVEAARREMIDEYWPGEDALSHDVVAQLQHRPFAEEVTRCALFQGTVDLARLKQHYLSQTGAASDRWQELEEPLLTFFTLIENHLKLDANLGPVLRDLQIQVKLGRLADTGDIIATASREIVFWQEHQANSTEDLVAVAREQGATLGDIKELLAQLVERSDRSSEMASDRQLSEAEKAYLRLLRLYCDRLPLAEDTRSTGDRGQARPSLANVYVALDTTRGASPERVFDRLGVPAERRPEIVDKLRGSVEQEAVEGKAMPPLELLRHELGRLGRGEVEEGGVLAEWAKDKKSLEQALRPVSALEALASHRHLVLLGDPGSGKSTFVHHLAYALAGEALGEGDGQLAHVFAEPLFPVRVVLRQWSAELSPDDSKKGVELVYQALQMLSADIDRARWLERLASPDTLVLFDGLDEVPTGSASSIEGVAKLDRRRLVVDAVSEFLAVHRECRVLVTSRIKPYEGSDYRLPEVPDLRLAPLDGDRVRRFTALWYDELARLDQLSGDEVTNRRERLLRALEARPVLREMAGTPLLLTMLAKVNARTVLPEGRAQLYQECVDQLLWEWERQKSAESGTESLVQLLEESKRQRIELEEVLWRLTYEAHGSSGDSTVDLPAATLRAGLATIHPDRHQGHAWASRVAELMAERGGLLIATSDDVFTFPHRSFQEYLACRWLAERENAPELARPLAVADQWQEVVLLCCGFLGQEGRSVPLQAILGELVAGEAPSSAEEWGRVLVAGQAWHEFGPHRASGVTGEELGRKIPRLLTQLMQTRGLPPQKRLAAGLLLGDLGVIPEDFDGVMAFPADRLGYVFRMAKYPVTNHQYQRFVEAGGYELESGWFSEEAQEEITKYWQEWPSGPRLASDPLWNKPTLPVTAVSWYEAEAYCRWLTVELRRDGTLGDDEEARLPTRAEFERAAAGLEGRKYAWEGAWDAERLNSTESELGGISPVHMYPDGATPEGVTDLLGNVWEWSLDRYEERQAPAHWLTGGSYFQNIETQGVASRSRFGADDWGGDVGFRVLFVSISRK